MYLSKCNYVLALRFNWLSELLLINILMSEQIFVVLDSITEWYWNNLTDVQESSPDNLYSNVWKYSYIHSRMIGVDLDFIRQPKLNWWRIVTECCLATRAEPECTLQETNSMNPIRPNCEILDGLLFWISHHVKWEPWEFSFYIVQQEEVVAGPV